MKNILFIFILSVTIGLINISCQNSVQSIYDTSNLKGFVLDANSRAGLDSAIVTIPDLSLTGYTDANGYFQFSNINLPRDPFGTNLTASKRGYSQNSYYIVLKSDSTTVASCLMSHQY